VAYLFGHRFLLRGVVSKFVSVAFIYQASNAQMITVLRVLGVLEDGMEHHVQAFWHFLNFLGALPRGLYFGPAAV
jgi:hypothetical protein